MSDTESPGAYIRQYQVLSKIGEGGMGEVYLAQDTKLGRKVALKILPREVTTS
jgi:serine/threonine-protein kinase